MVDVKASSTTDQKYAAICQYIVDAMKSLKMEHLIGTQHMRPLMDYIAFGVARNKKMLL